jgi:hypothetical protein
MVQPVPGYKYGLLLLPHVDGDADEDVILSDDSRSFTTTLSELVDEQHLIMWREQIGLAQWPHTAHRARFIRAIEPSLRPDIADAELVTLEGRVLHAWTAWLLASSQRPGSGLAFFFGGQCDREGQPLSVQRLRVQPAVVHPYFATKPEFVQIFRGNRDTAWLARFTAVHAQLLALYASGNMPPLLDTAIVAFSKAATDSTLEFAIPHLVRAAECILALPPGQGARLFASRGLGLCPDVGRHAFSGGANAQQRLEDLFKQRNDCVHGKIPFAALVALGTAGELEAARFHHLAHALAQQAILYMLQTPAKQTHMATRGGLEAAWANGQLP